MPCASAASSTTDAVPEFDDNGARVIVTLAAVKAAQQQWQGHMHRAALLQSEDEFAAALSLVPQLANPGPGLARTLRGLADLYAAQGRLDDAAALFQRIVDNGGKLSARFWGDYATLLFRLGLARLGAGKVAQANDALARAGSLLDGPADLPEAWRAALDGYAETALWFERAAEPVPASLYAEKALAFAVRLRAWEAAAQALRRLAQSGQSKSGAQRALVWLQRLQALRSEGWPEALGQAVQGAVSLAQRELALGRRGDAQAVFDAAAGWLRQAGPEGPAMADLQLGWGLSLGPKEGRPHIEEALSLRRRLLGPEHPRTREAEQALGGFSSAAAPSQQPLGEGAAQSWDGGAVFSAPDAGAAQGELKRLQRRLVRLCHPDAAPQEQWRHELMVRINHAVDVGDLFALRGLLREALGHLARQQGKAT